VLGTAGQRRTLALGEFDLDDFLEAARSELAGTPR